MFAFKTVSRLAAATAVSASRAGARVTTACVPVAAPRAAAIGRVAFPARTLATTLPSRGDDSPGTLKFKLTIPKELAGPSCQPAAVQSLAPHFEGTAVVEGTFKKISLKDYKGKYLILLFYPLDWTFVCPTEIIAFSDRSPEFKKLNTEIVACSVDSEASHLAWANTPRKQGGLGQMKIPLLADITKKISRDYGVLLEDQGVALRGLYVIDPEGRIRIKIHHDLPIGRSVDEAKRLIEALQFHAEHGEVCPANWQMGSATIIPDQKKKLDYFGKVQE